LQAKDKKHLHIVHHSPPGSLRIESEKNTKRAVSIPNAGHIISHNVQIGLNVEQCSKLAIYEPTKPRRRRKIFAKLSHIKGPGSTHPAEVFYTQEPE
jgi:hypothetical protein